MQKMIYILAVMPLLWYGCRQVEPAPTATTKPLAFYYSATDVPPNTYRELSKTTVAVTDNLFTNVNRRIHEEIRRKAITSRADAVVVGEIGRCPCPCPACRAAGPNRGPHIMVDISLLQRMKN